MRKILMISGVILALVLLVIGPKLIPQPKKIALTNASNTVATPSGASNTVSSGSTGATVTSGIHQSSTKSVTLPSGSVTYPTYTAPSASSNDTGVTTAPAAPDLSKCSGIHAQMVTTDATLTAQDKQLQANISNYQSYLLNLAQTMTARGYGYTPTEQTNISNVEYQLGVDQNQLNANVGKINTLNVPYQQQLVANRCTP